jgi:hypothetical protein
VNIEAIAIGAVSATFVVVALSLGVRAQRQRRWQRTMWAFRVPARREPRIIIETIMGDQTDRYLRPSAGLGALMAVAELSPALNDSRSGLVRRVDRSLDHPTSLLFSSENEADHWCSTADTIIVGGPKSNVITAQVLQAFGCQPLSTYADQSDVDPAELLRLTRNLRRDGDSAIGLGVATVGNAIYWFGDRYEGEVTYDTHPLTGTRSYKGNDYGVVLRLPSPTSDRHRTVVVFGSQTFGVEAASRWLVHLRGPSAGRKVRRRLAKQKNIAVLVEVEVEHGRVGEPKAVDIVTLPDRLDRRHW